MSFHVHRGSFAEDPVQRAHQLAERVYARVQMSGPRQVRFYQGMLLTYPYPARRGYGTRGVLVGIYTVNARLEWVLEDVMQVLIGDAQCSISGQRYLS